MRKIELLAPVGSMQSLHVAVNNGADAVYLGGKLFNARQYASNFDEAELVEAIDYAHKRGVKVYITLNISVKNSEISELREYLDFLKKTDIDAVIVQDLGVINVIKKEYPSLKIHASTQMTVNSSYGVEFLKKQGVERVVLARELSVEEIDEIKKATGAELEVFIHGALCVSYSGQCLMSSMIGGRSGNRGRCAQTCRMPFDLINERDGSEVKTAGKYVLSPKDLNTIDTIGELIEIGVDSFKIEGRMKKPEYVALIVGKYRKAIDSYYDSTLGKIDDEDREDIRKIFNRGFTKGFLGEDFGESYISIDKPSNRGTYVGKVIESKNGRAKIRLEAPLMKGDGLSADNADGSEEFFNVDKIFVNRRDSENGKVGQVVEIKTYRTMKEEAKLYKTIDMELYKRIKIDSANERDILRDKIDFEVEFRVGEKPVLKAKVNNREAEVVGENILEEAKKAGLTEERVSDQLGKLNDTAYELNGIVFNMDGNVFMPVSVLNSLRRDVIEKLDMCSSDEKTDNIEKSDYKDEESDFEYSGAKLSVEINSLNQAKRLDLRKLDRLYISLVGELEDIIEYIKGYEKEDREFEIMISLPKVIMDAEYKNIYKIIEKYEEFLDGVSISSIGALEFMKKSFPEIKIHADSSFNIYNSEAVRFLNNNGVKEAGLSAELNLEDIKSLASDFKFSYEATVYGYLKLMTMKHCPLSLVRKCGQDRDCLKCSVKEGYSLRDRMNVDFRVKRMGDATTIFNSKLLFVPEYISNMKQSEIEYYKMEVNRDDEDIENMQSLFFKAVKEEVGREEIEELIEQLNLEGCITRGHYNRGVK